jgi:hypothetical protein
MALLDTFTVGADTDLDAHTSDSGHGWTWESSGATTKKLTVYQAPDTCGRSTAGATNVVTWYSSSWAPLTAEYDVDVDIVHNNETNVTPMRVGFRFADTSNYYEVAFNHATDAFSLNKVVAGASTALGSYAGSFAFPVTPHVRIEVRDAAKDVYIDGVLQISSADNAIAAAGKVALGGGVTNGAATNGTHFDNLAADDPAAGGGTPSPYYYRRRRRAA